MSDDTGWIKIHRKILKNEVFCNPNMLQLFIYLLLRASHKDDKVYGIEIKRGELLTGRKRISSDTMQSEGSIPRRLLWLKKRGLIELSANNKCTLITICNYDTYQSFDFDSEQRVHHEPNNNRTTTEQQPNTHKNIRIKELKNKEIKENIIKENFENDWKKNYTQYLEITTEAYESLLKDEDELKKQSEFYPGVDIRLSLKKAFINFWSLEVGWKYCVKKRKGNKIDMRRTLINAIHHNKVYNGRKIQVGLVESELNYD